MEKAVILAEGVYGSTYGKTAHGLVRYSNRYQIVGVIDSEFAGRDAGEVLEGKYKNVPIFRDLNESLKLRPDLLIIGAATDGGYLPEKYRKIVKAAMERGVSIVSGLHEFLSDEPEFKKLSEEHSVRLIDVRKMFLNKKESFTGAIENVGAIKIAVLGTDSAVGKRTTAVMINETLKSLGYNSVFVATGQTGWMQGAEYCALIDAMINDFVAGGIESEIVRAWNEKRPEFIIIEGQGSIMHPAYPGGFEIIAAGRPEGVVLQHAPKRLGYDGFEKYKIPGVGKFLSVISLLSNTKVVSITLNTEKMADDEVKYCTKKFEDEYKIPVEAPLIDGVSKTVQAIKKLKRKHL